MADPILEEISDQTSLSTLADADIFAVQKSSDGFLYKMARSVLRDNLVGSLVQGDILYHNGTNLVRLAAGTAAQALTTGGAAANPAWAGMTTQGDVEYHNGTTRTRLAPGTSGQFLQTQGAAANPLWKYAPQPYIFSGVAGPPLDSTTYYVGGEPNSAPTTAAVHRVYFNAPGTVTSVRFSMMNEGTLSSAETSTASFRLNNTSDTTISASVKTDAAFQTYLATVSVAVVATDYFEIKWVTPAWNTNPGTCRWWGSVLVT